MICHTGKFFVSLVFVLVNVLVVSSQIPRVYRWELIDGKQLSTSSLFDGIFVDDSVVVAVGENGFVQRGIPARNFQAVAGEYGQPTLRTIESIGGARLVCAGDSGYVGVSLDSGKTWKFNHMIELGNVKQIAMEASGTSLLASDRGLFRLLESNELRKLVSGTMAGVAKLAIGTITIGYANGDVSSSSDDGKTWTEDAGLSTTWPVVKMLRNGGTVLVLHQRFITWRNQDNGVDTSYIPGSTSFSFSDVSFTDSSWWATSNDVGQGHAYSKDSGRSWTVSNGFLIRASDAISTRGNKLLCVGQRGSFVYGKLDATVGQNFRIFGFLPASDEVPTILVKSIKSVNGSVNVLREKPFVSVVRYGNQIDTLFKLSASNSLEALSLWIRPTGFSVVMDTIGYFETPSGWVTKRKFRICTKQVADTAFRTIDAPNWDLLATSSYSDEVGNVFVCCEGRPYVFRYTAASGKLDSLLGVPLVSVDRVIGTNGKLFLIGGSRMATSLDGGDTWALANTALPWSPHNSCVSSSGRIFIARLEVKGMNRRIFIATSDDDGQSWQSRASNNVQGAITNAQHIESDSVGRLILSGRGNTILLSLDNGQSIHEVETPAENTTMLFASNFTTPDTITVGGGDDVLLRGLLTTTSSVAKDDSASIESRMDAEVFAIAEYDVQGKWIGTYNPGHEFTLRDYILSTMNNNTGVSFLRCSQRNGRQFVQSILR